MSYSGGDGQTLGIVLTPRHITDLFCELLEISPEDKVFDPCCGEDVIIVTRGKNAVSNRVLKLPQSQKTTNWCAA